MFKTMGEKNFYAMGIVFIIIIVVVYYWGFFFFRSHDLWTTSETEENLEPALEATLHCAMDPSSFT